MSLHAISVASVVLSVISAIVITIDVIRRPQKMAIMNAVWPITAFYFSVFALPMYLRLGRQSEHENHHSMAHSQSGTSERKPKWQSVWLGATHCGAGCTLGDFVAEWIAFATAFSLFGSTMWSTFLLDFALAYLFGIFFQYFAIVPMRHLPPLKGLLAAAKADTISLISFEIGMIVFMMWMHHAFHPELKPTDIRYWFLMQIAMVIGFFTSLPANWWLVREGWKEAM